MPPLLVTVWHQRSHCLPLPQPLLPLPSLPPQLPLLPSLLSSTTATAATELMSMMMALRMKAQLQASEVSSSIEACAAWLSRGPSKSAKATAGRGRRTLQCRKANVKTRGPAGVSQGVRGPAGHAL